MKNKILIVIVSILLPFLLIGCGKEKVTLRNIDNIRYQNLASLVGSDFEIEIEYVATAKCRPNTVLGYKDYKAGDTIIKGSRVVVLVSTIPEDAQTFEDSKVLYSYNIGKWTGPGSMNEEVLLDAGISGCDLGIPVDLGDEIIYLFGDTFSGEGRTGFWFSNYIAKSKDRTFYDGVTFDSIVTRENGMVLPFAQGAHEDGTIENTGAEVTKIPTGGIKIGEYVYIFYMSVRYWGPNATWLINYNQCIKSKDLVNWENVENLRWEEDEAFNFGQIYPFKDPKSDYIYLYSIPGGRQGNTVTSRVKIEDFESRSEYEYLVGNDEWIKGDDGLKILKENPYYTTTAPKVSEMCVMYNEHLQKYTMIFAQGGIVYMYESKTPYGVFDNPTKLYQGVIYGSVTSQTIIEDNGMTIYFPVSNWDVYNTFWIQVRFK